jgi:MGT family glycosyltransferase
MSDIAFLCQPSVGHLNTLLSMALQMKSEGHRPRFLVPGMSMPRWWPKVQVLETAAEVPATVERQGLPVERLRPPLLSGLHAIRMTRSTGYEELRHAVAAFSTGMASSARQVLRRLEQQGADVVVTDFAFFPAALAAEKLGLPWVTVYHSGLPFHGPGVPPFGSGLPIGTAEGPELRRAEEAESKLLGDLARQMGKARRELGLGPGMTDALRTPISPWLNLVTSHEAMEAPRTGLGPSCFFIGPCFSTRQGSGGEGFPFERLRPECFKVYVSLGTVFNERPEVFRTLLRGLEAPDVQVVVSAGGSYESLASERLSPNVLLFRRVPQVDLLPRVDLVVGHGGNNSTNETLAAGKPLLVVPVGGEQQDNARRVEYLGAGLSLPLQGLTEEPVRQAVARLRHEPGFRARAEALRLALQATEGTLTASALISVLARQRRPLCLPEGSPRTVTREGLAPLLASLGAAGSQPVALKG